MMKQVATRVDEAVYEAFKGTSASLGTTPSDALRMFIYAFVEHRGFPYRVTTAQPMIESFSTEEDATEFATDLSLETLHATR